MSSGQSNYEPGDVEAKRQAAWARRDAFATPAPSDDRRAVYIKPSSPFTSGKLHMGHVRDYAIGDAYARFRRARGDAVLFGFGFDAFGLPAEMAAIERKVPPADWVESCGERMLAQMRRLGFSFDYERVFYSSDEAQYRWSQWLFVTLLEADLIYRDDTTVDWCDHCRTTLAALQVEDGRCWRCHNEVRLIRRPTWFLRITPYLEENDRRLADLADWDEISLSTQRYILGRSDGVEVDLGGPGAGLTAFTPHAGSVAAARFVLLSPRHPEIDAWATDPAVREQLDELRSGGWERSARDAKAVPLVDTGVAATAPWSGAELPVLVSPLVDARYGPTAALGIPDADEADAAIAARAPRVGEESASGGSAGTPETRPAVRYRAADFSISRQRVWGTPIPIVHCGACGAVPVPEQDLPVVLPRDIEPTGEGNPLAERADFVDVPCPRCGEPAKRETDTLDCHFDALWLWVPSAVPPEARAEAMFDHPDLRRWLPSERLVAGADSGGFVFDQRVVTKALRDIGPFAFLEQGEPFSGCLFHEMVIADGRKMSKHLGNVVDPDELVERYGADTVRLAILYAAGPAKTLNWNDGALRFAARFLHNLWIYSLARFAALERAPEDAEAAADTEFMRERLHKWCDNGLSRITADLEQLQMHKAVRNVTRLFERIQDFEKRVIQRRGAQLCRADAEAQVAALALLAQTLTPFAPHAGEALLLAAGREDGPGLPGPWPDRLDLAGLPASAQAAGG
ncbi:MAG TPA: class I tRNA ligase family protein [Solirubrobacterales bacterium]|jgi:leucyl-tRNA synthetase|nr:class I tRNA ligase family protein [Solirubrobacterales bacterium]